MDQLQIMLVIVTQSMQTGSAFLSMETGLQLIVLKRHIKTKRHKKLSSMSSERVTMPTIFSKELYCQRVAKIPESRNLNTKTNITRHQSIFEKSTITRYVKLLVPGILTSKNLFKEVDSVNSNAPVRAIALNKSCWVR